LRGSTNFNPFPYLITVLSNLSSRPSASGPWNLAAMCAHGVVGQAHLIRNAQLQADFDFERSTKRYTVDLLHIICPKGRELQKSPQSNTERCYPVEHCRGVGAVCDMDLRAGVSVAGGMALRNRWRIEPLPPRP
jgi:hypothetical protein